MATVNFEIVGVGVVSKTLTPAHVQRLVGVYTKRLQRDMVPVPNPTNQQIFEAWVQDLMNFTKAAVRNAEASDAASNISNIDFT